MRTIIYVDGFNLYFRLLVNRLAAKWLNIKALAEELLDPANFVPGVKYYTARVSGRIDPTAPGCQQIYLDARRTVPEMVLVQTQEGDRPRAVLSDELPLSGQRSFPDLRYGRSASSKLTDFELIFLDLLRQLDSSDHDCRSLKAFQPQHRPKPLLHAPMVLLDHVVEIPTWLALAPASAIDRSPSCPRPPDGTPHRHPR